MSEKKNSASYPQKRTDTLIGPHVHIEGNIDFRGVLRVQGDIVGDVVCSADRRGTMIIDAAGSVTGAVEAAHIVVKGRVRGPTHSAQTLEIHAGAHCVGDTRYRSIDVQRGGVIEGLLTLSAGPTFDEAVPEVPNPPDEAAAADDVDPPPAGQAPRLGRPGYRRQLAWGLALTIAVLAVIWLQRQPAAPSPDPAPAPTEVATPGAAVTPAAPPAASGVKDGADAASPAASVARTEATVAQANSANPDPALKKVVAIQGLNPAKSADIVFLIAKEASVLFKKKGDDASAGKQIELSQGRNVSMAIGRNELLRVAEGRQLEIFYQGRKVPSENIESGVWMRFVPQLSGDATAAADSR